MFNSLFGNLTDWFADLLDYVIKWVLEMLSFNLNFFTDNFPVIGTLYGILRGVGVGLAVAIAAFQLIKYFTGPLAVVKTNPIEIGIRLLISIALIWIGNYLLEGIVNLFTYPYETLLNVDVGEGRTITGGLMEAAAAGLANLMTGGASTLLALIMIVAVGWNVIKLILEIIERYLMVGVLTFTSPLIWPTLTTKDTQSIFSKWFSMFLGQCLLMLLNVWSLKMLISILGNQSANVFLKFVIALAFCKVAQRFDTYLQAIGVNAAHTGGSLMDDLMAIGGTASKFGKNAIGSAFAGAGNKALGEAISKGGLTGAAGYAVGSVTANSGLAKSAEEAILNKKPGQESMIWKDDNGYHQMDKNDNVWTSKSRTGLAGTMAGVRQGYAQYQGESGIMRDNKGNYIWTDANSVQHQTKNLAEMQAEQALTRAKYGNDVKPIDGTEAATVAGAAAYTAATDSAMENESSVIDNSNGTYSWVDGNGNEYTAGSMEEMAETQAIVRSGYALEGQETPISKNADGTYSWTDRDGNVYTSNSLDDMQITRSSVQNGYVNAPVGGSTTNLKNQHLSQYAAGMFNSNGTPKQGVTTINANGREVLAGETGTAGNIEMAQRIANISNPTAMATGAGKDNISAIKAETIYDRGSETASAIMSNNVEGGIVDERVAGATYETLFTNGGGEAIDGGVDTVVPGLSEAVSSANGDYIEGSGDVSDMKIQNGEMTGSYTPVDAHGNEQPTQEFSIRNEASYSGLSEMDKAEYTSFKANDGQTYYAKSSEASLSEVKVEGDRHTATSVHSSSSSPSVSGGSTTETGSRGTVNVHENRRNSTVNNTFVTKGTEATVETFNTNHGGNNPISQGPKIDGKVDRPLGSGNNGRKRKK